MQFRLTQREIEVVRLLIGGLNQKQIAERLGISSGVVHNHIYDAADRLGVDYGVGRSQRLVVECMKRREFADLDFGDFYSILRKTIALNREARNGK